MDAQDGAVAAGPPRRPRRGQAADAGPGRAHRDRVARSAAARRRGGPRDRQPHRPDQGDGRRLQLRAQQVQPRHAGAPPGRLGVQAVRLHDRDRSRLHADDDAAGLAGDLSRRPGPAALLAAELREGFLGAGHGPPRARALAQRAGDQADGRARAQAGHRLRAPVRPHRAAAALPADRARRRRRNAARDDQRLLGLPEPGRPDGAVFRS